MRIPLNKLIKVLEYFAAYRTLGDAAETIELDPRTVRSFYNLFRLTLFYFIKFYSTPFDSPVVNVHLDETPLTRKKKWCWKIITIKYCLGYRRSRYYK